MAPQKHVLGLAESDASMIGMRILESRMDTWAHEKILVRCFAFLHQIYVLCGTPSSIPHKAMQFAERLKFGASLYNRAFQ